MTEFLSISHLSLNEAQHGQKKMKTARAQAGCWRLLQQDVNICN